MPYVDGQWQQPKGRNEEIRQEMAAKAPKDVNGNPNYAAVMVPPPQVQQRAPQVQQYGSVSSVQMPNFSMPQMSAPQVQAPSVPQVSSMPTLQTNAAADPNSTAFLEQLKQRTAALQAGENAPLTASAERATRLAGRDIADAAAAAKKKKAEELAASGMRGGGQLRAIDEAARTRMARASSDIALGRERDQDQLNLARTGMTNALYGQLGQASQVPFSQQLAGNQQALETWKANEAANMGRANLNLSAQQTNAQIAAQQNQQQMAMWNALMGMGR